MMMATTKTRDPVATLLAWWSEPMFFTKHKGYTMRPRQAMSQNHSEVYQYPSPLPVMILKPRMMGSVLFIRTVN